MSFEQESQENLKYQRWLAESLISSLGYEGAIAASQRMAWYGVLGCLLSRKNDGHIAGLGRRESSAEAA